MYKNISRFCCSVKIAAGAVVCVESEIRGDVTIGKTMPSNRSSENLLFSHSRSVPRQELNGCHHCAWLLAAPLFLQAPGPWSTQKLASLLRQDPLSSEKATWLKSKLWSLTGYLRPRCTMFSTRLTIVDHLWWSVSFYMRACVIFPTVTQKILHLILRWNQKQWPSVSTTSLKLAVVSFYLIWPVLLHIWFLNCNINLCKKKIMFCLNWQQTVSQALKIGDNNVIESKGGILPSVSLAFSECSSLYNFDEVTHVTKYLFFCWLADVGRNVILTSGCIIGAFCQVNTCEVIPENTVIYGSGCMRRVQTERPQVWRSVTGKHRRCRQIT